MRHLTGAGEMAEEVSLKFNAWLLQFWGAAKSIWSEPRLDSRTAKLDTREPYSFLGPTPANSYILGTTEAQDQVRIWGLAPGGIACRMPQHSCIATTENHSPFLLPFSSRDSYPTEHGRASLAATERMLPR